MWFKKIYNVKKGRTAILDSKVYGPIFGNSTTIILVANKMLDYKCSTCGIDDSCFDEISTNYEISAGESTFYLQEIEVFQIMMEWLIYLINNKFYEIVIFKQNSR